jgi:WD40 repeat protein
LAVGAPYSNGGGVGEDSGSVQVYEYVDGNSYQPRGPAINGTALGDTFGWTVSLSNDGEILAVGTPNSNGDGYVKIYKYDGEKYNEVINLSEGGLFGYSISLSSDGNMLAIGSPEVNYRGNVRVYTIDASAGTAPMVGIVYGNSNFTTSELGYSVSVSDDGNVLAAGDSLLSEVQVHLFDGSSYQLVCTIPGEAVSLSGDGTRFAVQNHTSAIISVFHIDAARLECVQIGQSIPKTTSPLSLPGGYDPTESLISLSNDGHVLAVANPLNTTGVQVYEEKYNAAAQLEYVPRGGAITIVNSTVVSLSDDGSVLVIGVPFLDLENGQFEDNGSILVYEWLSQTIGQSPVSLNFIIDLNSFVILVATSGAIILFPIARINHSVCILSCQASAPTLIVS